MQFKWMWGNAGYHLLGHTVAKMNPFRWTQLMDRQSCLKSLLARADQGRPVLMMIGTSERNFATVIEAIEHLEETVAVLPRYCPEGHVLKLNDNQDPFMDGPVTCDGCGRKQAGGTMGCRQCYYDLCHLCAPPWLCTRLSDGLPPTLKRAATQK